MKGPILTSLFIAVAGHAICQKIELPLKDSLIVYENVVRLDSTTKKDILYKRAKTWFINNSSTLKTTIDIDDNSNGTLVGKAEFKLSVPENAIVYFTRTCSFSIQVDVKDGRYRYKIFNIVTTRPYPHSVLVLDVSKNYMMYLKDEIRTYGFISKKRLSNDFRETFEDLDTNIKKIINSLRSALKSSQSEDF